MIFVLTVLVAGAAPACNGEADHADHPSEFRWNDYESGTDAGYDDAGAADGNADSAGDYATGSPDVGTDRDAQCPEPLVTCPSMFVGGAYCCQEGATCGLLYGCNDGEVVPEDPSCPVDTHECVGVWDPDEPTNVCCVNGSEECVVQSDMIWCRPFDLEEETCEARGGEMCGDSCCESGTYCASVAQSLCMS